MIVLDIKQAKLSVIEAGKELVKDGLIQRTWGNVSCRIDSERFAITPSGRDYLSLTEDDIVIVNISDLSYEGSIKPSSEKGIHAKCYELRPSVNFVIHTHQTYASLAGLSGLDINTLDKEDETVIGSDIPVASYGLPGTKKLRTGVVNALRRSSSNAVLMLHHGALCLGTDRENAFAVATTLEKVCKNALLKRYHQLTGNIAESFDSLTTYIANNLMTEAADDSLGAYDSVREFGICELTDKTTGEKTAVDIESGMPLDPFTPCPDTAAVHAAVYKARHDVNAVIHSKEDAVVKASRTGLTVKPFLDDFAQIVGISLKCVDFDPSNASRSAKKIVRKLGKRDAVMIKHNGAVCVGADSDEAKAVELVTEKGCKAFFAAALYGTKPINTAESLLMRVVYKTKYSKKNKSNR